MLVSCRFVIMSMLILLSKTTVQQMSRGLTSKHTLFDRIETRTKPSLVESKKGSSNGDLSCTHSKTSTFKTNLKKRSQPKKLNLIQDILREKMATLQRNVGPSKIALYKAQNGNAFSEGELRLSQDRNNDYQSEKGLRRERRVVFIPDTRRIVDTLTMSQRFPFSATVKISTGCSGSLISKHHILTAAHCIHNGTAFITTVRTLRVGFLKRNGKYRWHRVNTYQIPQEWFVNHGARYDYAVVKLRRPTKRRYFKIAVSNAKPLAIHFASFPGDKRSNTMWYSSCKAKASGDTILSRCDAAKGSSGAGLYINRLHGERVIVGILSAAVTRRLKNGKKLHFNVGFRMTHKSARRICTWAGWPTGCLT